MIPTELPIVVQNNKIMKWVVMATLAIGLFFVIMLCVTHIKQGIPLAVPVIFIISLVVAIFIQLKANKPFNVEITRTAVNITPIKILGMAFFQPENLSLTDFNGIEVSQLRDRYSNRFKIILKGKAGKKDVMFDAPAGEKEASYAAGLSALVNLPFST